MIVPGLTANRVIPADERETCVKLLRRFTIEGRPADQMVTKGQFEIFWLIVFRPQARAQIICSTQYGKSLIVALACIIVSCLQDEIVAVVAPSDEKAKIIMRYYIDHLGDDKMFVEKLDKNTKLDRLQQEESKDRIMLRKDEDGSQGGIFVVSANTSNAKKTLEAAMGLGAKIVIGDEYCLIPDDTEATIFRMIAGKGEDAFYCKIGNPFFRSAPYTHFWKSWTEDEHYYKILIDYKQALREGRYTYDFVEEAREKPKFDILFECKFPPPGTTDSDGWTSILTEHEIELAEEGAENIEFAGTILGGGDVAKGVGQDSSTIVKRGMNVAECMYENNLVDEMQYAGEVVNFIDDEQMNPLNFGIDSNGVGSGAYSRIREQGKPIVGLNTAEIAHDRRRYFNLRAEGYWAVRTWIRNGGKLKPHKRWKELANVKYKTHSDGRVIIMDKVTAEKKGLPSPDVGDALMHTFLISAVPTTHDESEAFFRKKMKQNRMKHRGRK